MPSQLLTRRAPHKHHPCGRARRSVLVLVLTSFAFPCMHITSPPLFSWLRSCGAHRWLGFTSFPIGAYTFFPPFDACTMVSPDRMPRCSPFDRMSRPPGLLLGSYCRIRLSDIGSRLYLCNSGPCRVRFIPILHTYAAALGPCIMSYTLTSPPMRSAP